MERTGIFVTPEELDHVKVAQSVSGMWLSGGQPMGDPGFEVDLLRKKYNQPEGTGLDPRNGEFVRP